MSNWLEVSLTVDGELAEAVADVLARFAPNGVVVESSGIKFEGDEDEGSAAGPIIVRAYLPVDESLEEKRRKLEESLYFLGMIQPIPAPVFRQIADQNWMEAWKVHYKPIPIGRRLMIVPAWMDSPQPDRIPIRINPGMAFGTGTHPTTQLCLELLEGCIPDQSKTNPTFEIIDVGSGSGILSIAALKLGASRALAVDIDPESIANARENARLNGIGDELLIGRGSVAEILHGDFALRHAQLVLANILAPVIIRLLEAGLATLAEPGGVLLLSGILAEQEAAVLQAAQRAGLILADRRLSGDWVAMRLHKP
jgi:ribosomal protein L11 methyltransferase